MTTRRRRSYSNGNGNVSSAVKAWQYWVGIGIFLGGTGGTGLFVGGQTSELGTSIAVLSAEVKALRSGVDEQNLARREEVAQVRVRVTEALDRIRALELAVTSHHPDSGLVPFEPSRD